MFSRFNQLDLRGSSSCDLDVHIFPDVQTFHDVHTFSDVHTFLYVHIFPDVHTFPEVHIFLYVPIFPDVHTFPDVHIFLYVHIFPDVHKCPCSRVLQSRPAYTALFIVTYLSLNESNNLLNQSKMLTSKIFNITTHFPAFW